MQETDTRKQYMIFMYEQLEAKNRIVMYGQTCRRSCLYFSSELYAVISHKFHQTDGNPY